MKRALVLLMLLPTFGWAQTGNNSGSTKAAQEFSKALTAGSRFGVPRYTTALLPTCNSNNTGALAFDTTLAQPVVCNGTAWGFQIGTLAGASTGSPPL